MNYFYSLAAIAFVCAFALPIQAQNTIYLNARTIETTTDFEAQKAASPTDSEVFNNHFYRLVQFQTLPMPTDKTEMTQKGMGFMDYIPSNAFVMSFPLGFDFSFLSKYKVKTVIILRGSDKMSNGLLKRDIGVWLNNKVVFSKRFLSKIGKIAFKQAVTHFVRPPQYNDCFDLVF